MTTESCCQKPSIVNMPFRANGEQWTNRMCMACGAHWYGADTIQRYTRQEWDALMNSGEPMKPVQGVLI